MLVKKYLDVLRDGVHQLQRYDAELTNDAIRAVTNANAVLTYQAAQLVEVGVVDEDVDAAVRSVTTQLGTERPWCDILAIDQDLGKINGRYLSERQRILQWQEQQAEAARGRVKARDGFSILTADQSHSVLRPIAMAVTNTTAEAIAPPLAALKDPFAVALKRAEDQANDLLDEILSEGEKPLIVRVDLRLHNREVATETDIDALLKEIRNRLLEQVQAGARVRLM